jgi:hypothetical protein
MGALRRSGQGHSRRGSARSCRTVGSAARLFSVGSSVPRQENRRVWEAGCAATRFMLSAVRRALTRDRLSVPRSRRTAAVAAIGPLIVLAGILWALAQPDRLPLLDPDAHGFWSLAVEPPLLVLLVGVFFHRFIASGLIRDLYGSEVG